MTEGLVISLARNRKKNFAQQEEWGIAYVLNDYITRQSLKLARCRSIDEERFNIQSRGPILKRHLSQTGPVGLGIRFLAKLIQYKKWKFIKVIRETTKRSYRKEQIEQSKTLV